MIVYLLIDGREFLPWPLKWQIFRDKERCLIEARKLGWGKGLMSFSPGDLPGQAVREQCGEMNLTIVTVEVQS